MSESSPDDAAIEAFWLAARRHARLERLPGYFGPSPREVVRPPAWAFGATPEVADELIALVLDGTKTATAGALWDYEAAEEQLPEVGALNILLDGRGRPHALIEVTAVEVRPFNEVDAEHAALEGEGDLSLRFWREVHQHFFTEYADHDRGFAPDMPVVLQRFAVLHQVD